MVAVTPTSEDLRRYAITGGAIAADNKVKELHPLPDLQAPRVLVSHRLKADSSIESSMWVAVGSLKKLPTRANTLWLGAAEGLSFSLDLSALSSFEFPPTLNVSYWVDGDALDLQFYRKEAGGRYEPTDKVTAMASGAGKLAVRLHLLPDTTKTANLWVQAVPLSKAELQAKVGPARMQTGDVPTISLYVAKNSGRGTATKSVSVTLGVPEPADAGFDIHSMALIDVTASPDPANPLLPSGGAYKEATIGAYRRLVGARSTSATSFSARMDDFVAGRQTVAKQLALVFSVWLDPARGQGIWISYFCKIWI